MHRALFGYGLYILVRWSGYFFSPQCCEPRFPRSGDLGPIRTLILTENVRSWWGYLVKTKEDAQDSFSWLPKTHATVSRHTHSFRMTHKFHHLESTLLFFNLPMCPCSRSICPSCINSSRLFACIFSVLCVSVLCLPMCLWTVRPKKLKLKLL